MEPDKFYKDQESTDNVRTYNYPDYWMMFPYFPKGSENTPYEMGGIVFNFSLNSWIDYAETQRLFEIYLDGINSHYTCMLVSC